jgi:transposase
VAIRLSKDLIQCERFFRDPGNPKQRQYEALRAYFYDKLPSDEAARKFGYSPGSFRQLCHQFRNTADPEFFIVPKHGPQAQPKKDPAREVAVALRKQNYSVYEISDALKEKGMPLSPTAVQEVLKEEGFAPLLRRTRDEQPEMPSPIVEAVADVRAFSLPLEEFTTACGGLFLFVPDLVRLDIGGLANEAGLPGSKMIPSDHALRSCLALKLWSIERKSHIMPLIADEGLALFTGLNVIPKKSYLSEYSSRTER